jgi:hypothetical protein
MRKRWFVLGGAAGLYLAAVNITNDPPAYVYEGMSNQLWAASGLHYFAPTCSRLEVEGDETISVGIPVDECYRMTGPQRMRGVWLDQFEGSRFLPGGPELTKTRLDQSDIWLDVYRNRVPGLFDPEPDSELRAMEIEFIGRQTRFPGRYGHMGGSEHEVVVEQLIHARELPVGPWAAALDEYWTKKLGRNDQAQ